jgi:hypothetical protein
VCCNAPVTALLDKVSGHAIVMPSANSARLTPTLDILFGGRLRHLHLRYLRAPHYHIGDSITSRWQSLAPAKRLSGLQIIKRGIPSDSTAHMLSRFDHDVVQLHPRVGVILGGINDIERIPLPRIEQNLASMAETAEHTEYMSCLPLYFLQASTFLTNHPRRTFLVKTKAPPGTTKSSQARTKSKL